MKIEPMPSAFSCWDRALQKLVDRQKLLDAFHRCASTVPAYRQILLEHDVAEQDITTLEAFTKRVPVIHKQMTFSRFPVTSLLANDTTLGGLVAVTSSGFSQSGYSWGVSTRRSQEREATELDLHLNAFIPVADGHRRTLLLNCLPCVPLRPRLPIIVDAGPRSDVAIAAMRQFQHHVERVVVLGEPHFLKQLVEHGEKVGVDWSKRRVFLVTGGEVIPESYRRYLGGILQHETDRLEAGGILFSYGVSELATSLAQETADLRALRRLLAGDKCLRERAFGFDPPFLPTLVQFDSDRFFVEFRERGGLPRLVVSTLDPRHSLPLIRYDTGDWAFPCDVTSLGLTDESDSSPGSSFASKLVVCIWGRGHCVDLGADGVIHPETIKEAYYEFACIDPRFARNTTGDFRFTEKTRRVTLHLQVKKACSVSDRLASAFSEFLYCRNGVRIAVAADYAGPLDNRKIDYQQKFRYGF